MLSFSSFEEAVRQQATDSEGKRKRQAYWKAAKDEKTSKEKGGKVECVTEITLFSLKPNAER